MYRAYTCIVQIPEVCTVKYKYNYYYKYKYKHHTYTVHVIPYMYRTCTVHIPYMYRTCTAHVPYMYRTCTVYVPYMYRTCTEHVPYMYRTYNVHLLYKDQGFNHFQVTWYVNNTIIDTTKEEFKRVSISTKEVNDHQAYSELTITKLEIKDGGKFMRVNRVRF